MAVLRNYLPDKGLGGVDSGEIGVKIFDMDTSSLLKKLDSALAQLSALRREIAEADTKYPPSISDEASRGICHACKKPLGRGKVIRGCHEACHQSMFREMKDGEITEQELIQSGRIGPKQKGGRKRKLRMADLIASQLDATAKADAAALQEPPKQQPKGGTKRKPKP